MPVSSAMCRFQCPVCGALWTPDKNELSERMNTLKTRYSRLLKKRDELVTNGMDDTSYEFKFKHSQLKTELLIADHAIRCLRKELQGEPTQVWQNRYAKALEVAQSMLDESKFQKFKDAIDEACRPKELR